MHELREKIVVGIITAAASLRLAALVKASTFCSGIATLHFLFGLVLRSGLSVLPHWRVLALHIANVIFVACLVAEWVQDKYWQSNLPLLPIILLILSPISLLFLVLFPVPSSAQLRGNYKNIGTLSFRISMQKAPELQMYKQDNDFVSVQCWFPIVSPTSCWCNYFSSLFSPKSMLWTSGDPALQHVELVSLLNELTSIRGIPSFLMRHLLLSSTNSKFQSNFDNIVSTDGENRLKLALYSHGMYGWRQLHHSCCEQLASEGFVVFACDHAPDCLITRPYNAYTNSDSQSNSYISFDFHLPPEAVADASKVKERDFYFSGINRRVRDILILLEAIDSPTQNEKSLSANGDRHAHSLINASGLHFSFDKLKENTVMSKWYAWGHSMGAATVNTWAVRDSRVCVVIALDGWMYAVPDQDRTRGVQSAVMLNLSSALWQYGEVSMDSCIG
jgi:hypothetical protein